MNPQCRGVPGELHRSVQMETDFVRPDRIEYECPLCGVLISVQKEDGDR